MSAQPNREVALFSAALELPASERAAYLSEACADDPALRQRLEELLRVHEDAITFLENNMSGAQESPIGAQVPDPTIRLSTSPAEKAGDRIGRYKLLQQIGEGGCGVVYMAEQEEPVRRRVALKVIKLGMDTKQVIARFEAERQALALMDHPNIAKVLDAGATDTGRPFFVMELVRGIKITDYCDEHSLATEERLKLFTQVCQAVQHAHQKGIIHRDIKPSNILVTISEPGAPGCPKVIDFGIAKATTGQALTNKTVFTAFEQFIGTPAYMSPEQAMMTALDIDTRTDLYSLGVLLYELLTGKTPLDQKELLAAGLEEMRRTIREKEPVRPSTRLSTMLEGELTTTAKHRHTDAPKLIHAVRGDLDWIVMKCLEKDRARRYETANGLANDVLRHLNCEPVVARPPSRLYEFQKTVRRHKFGFAAAAGLIMVLAAGVLVSTWQAVRAKRAERDESRSRAAAQRAQANEARLRQEAMADKKKAETAAAKSRQVAQLLEEMLQGVGPSRALGRDPTMLQEILDNFVGRIGIELTNQPEVELELLGTLADTYHELGLHNQMEPVSRRCLNLARSRPGNDDETVVTCLTRLGDALMHLGRLEESEKLSREALALLKKLPGEELKASAAPAFENLANLFDQRGNFVEAESAHREALALRKKFYGEESPSVAVSLNNLSGVLRHEHKLAEAETVCRQALTIRRKLFGDKHPETAHSMDNLASVLSDQGKLADAEALFRQTLAIRRELLPKAHPSLATTLNNLGSLLASEHKLAEAELLDREAVAMRRKLHGDDDPRLARSLHNLAYVLVGEGKWSEGESAEREALPLLRKFLGNENAKVADSLHNLSTALQSQGKLAEAETALREALAIRRKVLGNDHPWVGDSLFGLANLQSAQGKLAEAETTYRDALSVLRSITSRNTSPEPPIVGEILDNLAGVLRQRKALVEARSRAEEAVALFQRHPDWPLDDRQHAIFTFSDVLADLGDLDGLEAMLRKELALLRQLSSGPAGEVSNLGLVQHHLAEALRERKELTEARSLAEEAVALYRRHADWPPGERQHALEVLAEVRTDLGDPAGAEALYHEQLQGLRARHAPDDPELADAIAQLTGSLLAKARFAQAEPLARECLDLREKKMPDDWRTFNARSMLGACLLGQGKSAEAEPWLLSGYEGMKQREDQLPKGNPRIQEALERLIQLCEAKGQPAQAAGWKQKLAEAKTLAADDALTYQRHPERLAAQPPRSLKPPTALSPGPSDLEGPDVPSSDPEGTIQALVSLAARLREKGDLAEAATNYHKALQVQRNTVGARNLKTAALAHFVADQLSQMSLLTEAEPLYRDALETRGKFSGNDDMDTAGSAHNLAGVLVREDKLGEAGTLYQVAWAARRKVLGTEEADTLASLRNLGDVLTRQGRWVEAEARRREELASRKKAGAGELSIVDTLNLLADLLLAQHRDLEAERLFEEPATATNARPPRVAFLEARHAFLARHCRWTEAAAATARLIELEPGDHLLYHSLAALLVQSGEVERYRRHCAQELARFARTSEPNTAERMAKDCLILPDSGVDLNAVSAWADMAVTAGKDSGDLPWFQFCKALAEYRQGRFASAADWAQKALSHAGDVPERDVEAHMVLAMAQYRSNQPDAAAVTLATGVGIAGRKLPKLDTGDLGDGWLDWIIAHALMREAKALIAGRADPPGKSE